MDNNVLEFYVKMKDMMSGGLVKIAQTAQTSFAKIQNNIKSTVADSRSFSASLNELKERLSQVNQVRFGTVLRSEFKQATREANILQRQITRMENTGRRKSLFGSFSLGGILRQALPMLTVAGLVMGASSFTKASAKAFMDYQITSKTFEALTGNKGIGENLSADLLKIQQNSILGNDVFRHAQTMLGFGINSSEVESDLKKLGAVSMGDKVRFKELTLAYSQTHAAGKLIGKDLRQFINAGFNPLQTIAAHYKEFGFKTKETVGQLQELVRKQKISSSMIEKAFDIETSAGGRFNNMLKIMAATTTGKLAIMKGHFEALKISIGEKLQPVIQSTADTLTSLIDKLQKWTTPAGEAVTKQINSIRALQSELTDSNTSHARQVELLQQLKDINPYIIKGINDQSISYKTLAKNINDVITGLENKKGLDIISDQNASFLKDWATNNSRMDYLIEDMRVKVAEAGNKIANDTTLTFGEKVKKTLRQYQNKYTDLDSLYSSGKMKWDVTKHPWGAPSSLDSARDKYLGLKNDIKFLAKDLDFKKENTAKYRYILTIQRNYQKLINEFNKKTAVTPPKKGSNDGANSGSSIASGITAAGPRTININGVKFTDKIEIHQATGKESAAELQSILEEMYLRILNSGASVGA